MSKGFPTELRTQQVPFEALLAREAMPCAAFEVVASNANSTSYAVNANLGSFYVPVCQQLYVNEIAITSTQTFELRLEIFDSRIKSPGFSNGNGFRGKIFAGVEKKIALNRLFREWTQFSFITRTAIASAGVPTPTFEFNASMSGFSLINDSDFDSSVRVMVVGDSISTNGTVTIGENLYILRFKRWLASQGIRAHFVGKSSGGFTSSHGEILRQSGHLDAGPIDLILYNLGMNDTTLGTTQANIQAVITWKQTVYPNSLMVILGPTPAQPSAKEAFLSNLRAWQSTYVANLDDPNILFCDLGGSFDRTNNALYSNADGTSVGQAIHPNDAGHGLINDGLVSWAVSANLPQKLGV